MLCFITLNVYLFSSAPVPLKVDLPKEKSTYSIADAFRIIARVNSIARSLYTRNIVNTGLEVGLSFDENWQDNEIEAGPLPAQILRETSAFIEKSPLGLGLYLGSDFPISAPNLFKEMQAENFQELRKDGKPKFFYDVSSKRYVGMFPDIAISGACVKCHNENKNSPKKDWVLNDIMGATTWTYPGDSINTKELKDMINVYLNGLDNTYKRYLEKVKTFKKIKVPSIGKMWPSQGYYLPDAPEYADTIYKLTSYEIAKGLLK